MKEKFLKKSVLLLSFFAIIFAGCQSAQQLIEQGDTVKAIEKLAKDLTKKSTKQEDADLFVSVYPSEVEVRLARQTQTVSDVVADFVDSKGAYSIEGALDSVKAALSSGTYIGNEPSVRQALTRAESVWSNAEALYRIQKAVSPMPMEIGDPVKGEIYIVEKYYDDFAGQYSTASHDLAAFIYAIAEAGYPGETITQKQRGYDMYEKAAKYDSSILSYCNQREAELAFDIGSSLMSGNDISGKKDAINWFRKSDTKVYNYNGAKRMILRCNYEIGELYLAQFERTKSKSDLRNAISYFKDAGDYSDASSRRAYAEALLDELENPPAFVDEGTGIIDQAPVNRLRVSFGSLTYSDSDASAKVYVKVTGVDYLLSDRDFKISSVNRPGVISIGSVNKSRVTQDSVTSYPIIVENIRNSGDFTVSVLERDGTVVATSPAYTVEASKVYVAPSISSAGTEYSKTDSDVDLLFRVTGVKKTLSLSDIIVSSNTTGGRISGLELNKATGVYYVKLSDASSSGTVEFSVIGDNGAAITASDGKNKLSYNVSAGNIYVPVSVSFGRLSYPNATTATFSINVSGLTYLLGDGNFVKTTSGSVGSVTVKTSQTKAPTAKETVVYTGTVSGISGNGTVSVTVKDRNGNKIGSSSYSVNATVTQKSPVVSYSGITYPSSSSVVYLSFTIENPGKITSLPEVKVLSNSTGGTISGVVNGKDLAVKAPAITKVSDAKAPVSTAARTLETKATVATDKAEYAAVLKDATKDGIIMFEVLLNGKHVDVKTSTAVKAPQGLEYKVEYSKIYNPVQPKATFGAINYSTTSASATMTVNVTGVDYLLADSNFEKSMKGVGSVTVRTATTANPKTSDTVAYTFTANTLTSPCSLTLKVKDKNGSIFATKTYDFDESKIYKAPAPVTQTMTPTKVSYSTSKPEVYLDFYVSNSKKVITKPNVIVVSNETGGAIASAVLNETAKKADISRLDYRITLTGVTKSGTITVRITDESGNYIKSTVPAAVANAVRSHGGGGVSKAADDTAMAFSVDAGSVYVEPKAQASFGSLVYSTTEASASVAINVSGLTYLLDDSYFAKNISGGIGKAVVTTTATSAPKATDTVRYTLTLSNITADGYVTVSVKNTKGGVIGTSQNYKVSKANVYVNPTLTAGSVTYSSNTPEVYLAFKTEGVKKTITLSDITTGTNQTGGTISSVKSEGSGNYKAVLTNVTKSGTISFSVKGDDGKNITAKIVALNGIPATGPATTFTDKGVTIEKAATVKGVSSISLPTDISFSVDVSRVYVMLNPKATFGTLSYSTTEPSVTIPISVSGINYLLSDSNFAKTVTGGVSSTKVTTDVTAAPKPTDTVRYTLKASNVTGAGTITVSVKDNKGAVFASSSKYSVVASSLYVKPGISIGSVTYSPNTPEVYLAFKTEGVKKTIALSDITIGTNQTGGTISSIKSEGNGNYKAVLTKVTKSGNITFSVKGDDGKNVNIKVIATAGIPASTSKNQTLEKDPSAKTLSVPTIPTDLVFTVDASKVYVVQQPKATFGNLVYSTTEPAVTIPISVTGITYLLTDANFTKTLTGGVSSATVTADVKAAPKATDTVRYTLKASGVTGAGTITVSVKDNKGAVFGTSSKYSVVASSLYVKPSVSSAGVTYSTNTPEVYLAFKTEGVKKTIALSDITVGTNQTGGTISGIKSAGSGNYTAVLTKVTKSGNIAFSVKGDDGKNVNVKVIATAGIPATSSKDLTLEKAPSAKTLSVPTLPTDLVFTVDASKVYVAAQPKATFGAINYSTTSASATITVTVSGVDFILNDSKFERNVKGIGSITVSTTTTKAPKPTESVVYTITTSNLMPPSELTLKVRDKNDKVFATKTYTFDESKIYKAPTITGAAIYDGITYADSTNTEAGEVHLEFTVVGARSALTMNDIKVVSNQTGGTVSGISVATSVKSLVVPDTMKKLQIKSYYLRLTGATKSGTVSISVLDTKGNPVKVLTSSAATKAKERSTTLSSGTTLNFAVDSTKIVPAKTITRPGYQVGGGTIGSGSLRSGTLQSDKQLDNSLKLNDEAQKQLELDERLRSKIIK